MRLCLQVYEFCGHRPFVPKQINSFWIQPICAKIKKKALQFYAFPIEPGAITPQERFAVKFV